jgi:hypothetical protein
MKLTLTADPLEKLTTEALATVVFEAGEGAAPDPHFDHLNSLTNGLLGELRRSGELPGKLLDPVLIHRPSGLAARRLLLVGGGKASKFDPVHLRHAPGPLCGF